MWLSRRRWWKHWSRDVSPLCFALRMMSKALILRGVEPGVGCRTLARALAGELQARGLTVRLVRSSATDKLPKDSLIEWISRFKSLAPMMLRNYLHDPNQGIAQWQLTGLPDTAVTADLLALLRGAFDWVIWT